MHLQIPIGVIANAHVQIAQGKVVKGTYNALAGNTHIFASASQNRTIHTQQPFAHYRVIDLAMVVTKGDLKGLGTVNHKSLAKDIELLHLGTPLDTRGRLWCLV